MPDWYLADERSPIHHRREAIQRLERAGVLASFINGFEKLIRSTQKNLWLAALDISALLSYPTSLPPGWKEYSEDIQEVVKIVRRYPPGRQLTLTQADEAARQLRLRVENLERSYADIHKPVSPEGISDYERLVNAENYLPPPFLRFLRSQGFLESPNRIVSNF